MTDREGFMSAILADPADDLARLAFADWLEEQSERVAVCEKCNGAGEMDFGGGVPSSSNWVQEIHSNIYQCAHCLNGQVVDRTNIAHATLIREQISSKDSIEFAASNSAWYSGWPERMVLAPAIRGVAYTVHRGFIDQIELTLERFTGLFWYEQDQELFPRRVTRDVFERHVRTSFRWPLTRITLTDRIPEMWLTSFVWHQTLYDGPSGLPLWLWQLLPMTTFRTKQSALDALSAACVRWFRQVCGLPPLKKVAI